MEAQIVQLPTTPDIHVDADRIVIDRLVVRDRQQRDPRRAPAGGPGGRGRARPADRACSPSRTRARRSTSISSGRSSSSSTRLSRSTARAAEALDQTLRANFADGDGRLPRTARAVPRRSGRACAPRQRAVRRVEARQRDRPDADAPRRVLRRRRLEARRPARPDAPALAHAPVPRRDQRPVRPAQRPAHGDRGRGGRARRRAGSISRERRGLRGPARSDAGGRRPRGRRPARPDGLGGGRRAPFQEGRLRADDRSGSDRRRRRARGHRGQGPGDVGPGDPRRAPRGEEPRRGGRRGGRGRTTRRRASPRSMSGPATSTA